MWNQSAFGTSLLSLPLKFVVSIFPRRTVVGLLGTYSKSCHKVRIRMRWCYYSYGSVRLRASNCQNAVLKNNQSDFLPRDWSTFRDIGCCRIWAIHKLRVLCKRRCWALKKLGNFTLDSWRASSWAWRKISPWVSSHAAFERKFSCQTFKVCNNWYLQ